MDYFLLGALIIQKHGAGEGRKIDSRAYGYDANGNITSISGTTYGYDALNRITSEPTQTFVYDANGNITLAGFNIYSYKANSNRQVSSPNGMIATNAAGNITSLSFLLNFTYNQDGRMAKANNGFLNSVTNTYSYDGHRAKKVAGSATTLFHYDLDGHLIAETSPAGAAVREYLRDDDGRPVAQADASGLLYLHFDHLGSPRFATNASKAIVWSWKEKPYGTGAVTGAVTGTATVPLRYPGQYVDAETGITQNWHRDYHAPSGRYLQSDPIGVVGGINTYSYVKANPLSYIDPRGLALCALTFSGGSARLHCEPENPNNSLVDIPVASGNNGGGSKCKNNTSCESQTSRGPIPRGCWRWTSGYTSKLNGRVLEPCDGTETYGRSLFRSHSCANAFGPSIQSPFCSEGCVTGQSPDIQRLNGLLDAEPGSTLWVGEGL